MLGVISCCFVCCPNEATVEPVAGGVLPGKQVSSNSIGGPSSVGSPRPSVSLVERQSDRQGPVGNTRDLSRSLKPSLDSTPKCGTDG
jgi:hypothetical protein